MAKVFIDGNEFEAEAGRNLLEVCLEEGVDLPYFCWHPAMGAVGACRQCAVKQYRDENDKAGRIVMSCMTPVTEGLRITVEDPDSKTFRAEIIESLMTNHPHDCPICDEGGECHLQDMTVMSGHNYREYRFKKRTFNNQYLGPFINHEMNRCITCYRCVRFYRDYAGGDDLVQMASKNHVYFGRFEDGTLENEFSGNLAEVCPTGVFTDKTLKEHYTRKWDMQTAPSVCNQCSLGCNVIPGERYGEIRRITNRYNGAVNSYFICDRGRFGYDYINATTRIREPRAGSVGTLSPISKTDALARVAEWVNAGKAIGIGSPRASIETNYALRKWLGADRFFSGMADSESDLVHLAYDILRDGPARSASIQDASLADVVLVLGEDVTNTAPRLALALRQASRQRPLEKLAKINLPEWHDIAGRELIQDDKGPFYIATPDATKLDDVATKTFHAPPEGIARLGFAVAHILDSSTPLVPNLESETESLAKEIAEAILSAKRPLIVAGTSLGSEGILQAAANVAWALSKADKKAEISLILPEANSLGVAMMGAPSLEEALLAVESGKAETVIIAENDLYRRLPAKAIDALFAKAKHVVVLDHTQSPTTAKATLVLPAGAFTESDGILVNNEGRAQRFFQVYAPKGDIQESWRWIGDTLRTASAGENPGWDHLDTIANDLVADLPAFAPIVGAVPGWDYRIEGLRVARQPHRYSGRTAMNAHLNIHEQKPPDDPDSPMSFSMEGLYGPKVPSALLARFWSPGWNSGQSLNKFQDEIGGPLRGGDPGLRLIEPVADAAPRYYEQVPAVPADRSASGEVYLTPRHHIFGSEPLSSLSPAVAQRIPKAYVGLSRSDAEKLGVQAGGRVRVNFDGNGDAHEVALVISDALPAGVASLPVGLPDLPGVTAASKWGKVTKA